MVSIYPTDAKAASAPLFSSFAKLFQVPGFDKLPAFDAASLAFKLPGFDLNTVVDIQRRNFEALTAANQTVVQGLQTVAQRQGEILDALWQLLGRDGKLLYATCSVFQEENNEQIERFLTRHSNARRVPLPRPHTNAQELAGQILPDDMHDGFFYALLQRV